jgi:hypothetical protein
VLLFFGPWLTTDLERSLWYGDKFWRIFFDVYALTPKEIDPNYNIIDLTTGLLAWPDNTYDYPILSILFYAAFALIPIGITGQIILVKFIFNLVDVVNFLLLRRLDDQKTLSWLYWVLLTPFSALEGQPVSITIFFFILAIWFYKEYSSNPIYAYIVIALAFHWKFVSLFLLPYIIADSYHRTIWKQIFNKERWILFLKPLLGFGIIFSLLWFPILVSPYILSYISWGGNLPVDEAHPWNPFYLGVPLTFGGFFLLTLFIGILVYWIRTNKSKLWDYTGFFPLMFLWGFLMIYKFAFPWYWMWAFPFFTILPFNKREILIGYIIICLIAAVEFINWTVGVSGLIDLII